jgi:glutamine cyclotransferase
MNTKILSHFLVVISVTIILFACGNNNQDASINENAIKAPQNLSYELIKVYPHDTLSYTQGLEWKGDTLIEGTGDYSKSYLHLLDTTMKVIKGPLKLNGPKVAYEDAIFGEGITQFDHKIYQLTWKTKKVFVYDAKTLQKINEFNWPYEGWGLTHNDSSLIVSTGGSNIYFVDPNTFSIQRTLGVYNNYGYVSDINELEYVNGKIYANLYLHDNIIQIDPQTGLVTGNLDLSDILAKASAKYDPKTVNGGYVLNGIAYKKEAQSFFITGKCWPLMMEIKLK